MIDTNLFAVIEAALPLLHGDWVAKNSSYDAELASLLGMRCDTRRYWDAQWNDQRIEFKKGKSIWIDLVRVSESQLRVCEEASIPTLTMFFVPATDRRSIREVLWVETADIVAWANLTEDAARALYELNESDEMARRSLNAQMSMTLSDVRQMKSVVSCSGAPGIS